MVKKFIRIINIDSMESKQKEREKRRRRRTEQTTSSGKEEEARKQGNDSQRSSVSLSYNKTYTRGCLIDQIITKFYCFGRIRRYQPRNFPDRLFQNFFLNVQRIFYVHWWNICQQFASDSLS